MLKLLSVVAAVAVLLIWLATSAQADEVVRPSAQEVQRVMDCCFADASTKVVVTPRRPKFTLTSTLLSKYVSPHGHLLSDEPLWQSEFKVTFSSGLFAGITWSTGFDDVNLSSTRADEVDLSLGWTKKLGDLSLTFGASHFNFIELDSLDKDLVIAWAEAGYSFKVSESQTLTPFLRMEERWRLPDFDWARAMPVAGLKHARVIAPGFTFNQRVGLMYDSGVPVSGDGLLLQYRVGMSCKLSGACTLEPYLRVSAPLTIEDDRETQVILGITLSWNF